MKCYRKKPEACFNCPYPDCIDDPKRERQAYLRQYYLNMSEEKKQIRRERALKYYRDHRELINQEKRRRRAKNAN